jgi:hypothetical protein
MEKPTKEQELEINIIKEKILNLISDKINKYPHQTKRQFYIKLNKDEQELYRVDKQTKRMINNILENMRLPYLPTNKLQWAQLNNIINIYIETIPSNKTFRERTFDIINKIKIYLKNKKNI